MKADHKVNHMSGRPEVRRKVRSADVLRGEKLFRLRADLLELTSEAIAVRSLLDGRILYWNAGAEALYGWKREELLGQDLDEVLRTVFPGGRAQTEQDLLRCGCWHGQLVQQARDGREIVVSCRKTVNREREAVLEVNRDVTLELRAEAALRESEKLATMGRVAGIIAHEINNPLTAVTNIIYLLENHPSLDAEARSFAAAAEKELARVAQITRQTLSFYREAQAPVPIDLCVLLDDVLGLQNRALAGSRLTVEKRYGASGTVQGFPVELRQVFLNLIANAIQAMPQGGTLRLAVRESIDRQTGRAGFAVAVIDTGTGIRKEDRSRLFQPFFSTKASNGTGLGLWISKGILEKYKGRIAYRCYHLGGHPVTCFRVFLPRGTEATLPVPGKVEARPTELPAA
jgi:PAS domain S-box-containing protein